MNGHSYHLCTEVSHMPAIHATIKHFVLLYSGPSILFRAVNSRVLQCYDSKPTKRNACHLLF